MCLRILNYSASEPHTSGSARFCRRTYRVVGLRELIRGFQSGGVPASAVVLTFDDGYADNLLNAKPLLEEADVPATVFVTAGQVGSGREFWWDELERLLLQPGALPDPFGFRTGDQEHRWNLGGAANYGEGEYARDRTWHVAKPEDSNIRQTIYRSTCELVRPLSSEARRTVMDSFPVNSKPRPSHRALSAAEVARLADGGLVEVGAHTVTHPVLSQLAVEQQQLEIRQSKGALEEMVGRPVTSFSYPYGSRSHYSADTVRLVREAGFQCACSNFEGRVRKGADPYQLPRFLVRDLDGDAFARQLRAWFRV